MVTKRRVEDEDGVPLVIGYHPDITQWKLAERRVQAALGREQSAAERTRQFAQRLLDALPMPIYVKDAESRYLIVNETQTREWQRPAAGADRPHLDVARAERGDRAGDARGRPRRCCAGGSVYKEEAEPPPGDRHRPLPRGHQGAVQDADGAPVIVCTMFDTTAWRTAERDLKAALERETGLRKRTQTFVQRLIDVIPDPFYVKSAEGRFLIVNEAYARTQHAAPEDLVGVDSYTLEPEEAADEVRKEDRAVVAGAQVDKEEHSGAPGRAASASTRW